MENFPSIPSSPQSAHAASGEPAHWCHQCNSATVAERGGGHGSSDEDLLCPYCGGGFVETLESAGTLSDVRRALWRQQPREMQTRPEDDAAADEEMEDATPQQVLRLLRHFDRAYRSGPQTLPSMSADTSAHMRESDGEVAPNNEDAHYMVHSSFFPSHHTDLDDEQTEEGATELPNQVDTGEDADSSVLLQGDEDDVDEESGTSGEASLVERSVWDFFEDENEDGLEDVEVDGANLVVRFFETFDDSGEGEEELDREHDDGEGQEAGQGEGSETSNPANEGSHTGNRLHRHLHRRLESMRRILDNFNAEFHLRSPEEDAYFGEPGDYVGTQGYEEILQHFIDTDNTRRGAPPAAKSAMEGLLSFRISQENLDNGSALCAICKDVVELDELAKQLPCLHLYHSACIVAWLSARNSCPVCRYELPTDDPDYEDRKKSKKLQQSTTQSIIHDASSSTLGEGGGDILASEDSGNGAIIQIQRE